MTQENDIILEITDTFSLRWEYGYLYFQYVEHSPDYWYGDTETDVDIDADMADKLIEFLKPFSSSHKESE